MDVWQRTIGLAFTSLLAAGSMALLTGCADDLYTPCDLDANSPDPAVSTCGQDDGPSRSCVVDNQLQCETRSCGRYQGSDPFCTKQCTDDGDCGANGQCLEFVFQSGRRYCAPDELL